MISIMISHLTPHNLYKVSLSRSKNNLPSTFSWAMTASTSKLAANLSIWHRRFAHLNKTSIKHLREITSKMIITLSSTTLPFCSVCVEAKMTRQPH